MGGPAYYIQKGLHKRWWAVTFAVLITLTFGFAFNSVQSNTISDAFNACFGFPREWMAALLCGDDPCDYMGRSTESVAV